MLTNSELNQIKDFLALYGKKDSQLPPATLPLNIEDKVAIIQNGVNKLVTISELAQTLEGKVTYDICTMTDYENLGEKVIGKLYICTYDDTHVLPSGVTGKSEDYVKQIYLDNKAFLHEDTKFIYDEEQKKYQKEINQEVQNTLKSIENNKADKSDTYTKTEVDTNISDAVLVETSRAQNAEANRYLKSETYNKEEVHNLITTPSQEYVSVTATDQTTAVTDVLPATGATDTTYRVGNWDGTQYNDSVFSEYAWNGSVYIKLSTKSQAVEVYDISANHADAKYADLAAALGTNGANIPQSLQKGGMSIKFVQSSNNKYVQYRLTTPSFTTIESSWHGEDTVIRNVSPDFTICDENGYAIVKFKDGHIQTKNFNSSAVNVETRDVTVSSDFTICDENGYAIVKFQDGHIKTKNFDSSAIINPIKGKKISILGDSISTFRGYMYSPDAACAYPQTWMNNVLDTYWMKTITTLDAVLGVNDSWAGTKVSYNPLTESTNISLSSQTRIGHLGENGTPDIIIVYGGTNDIGFNVEIGTFNTENPIDYTDEQIAALPTTTFADAYRTMIIRLQKLYPLARIVAIMPNYINRDWYEHYTSDHLDEYIEMEKTICDYFGIKFLDCRTCGITLFNLETYLGPSDLIHPNTAGMNLIATQLINILKTL